MSVIQTAELHETIELLKENLTARGYAARTIGYFEPFWKRLEEYAHNKGMNIYSPQLAADFLLETYGIEPLSICLARREARARRPVELLDYFVKHRCINKCRHNPITVWHPAYVEICERFMAYLTTKQYAERTLRKYRIQTQSFTNHLAALGILEVDATSAEAIDRYLEQYRGYQKSTIGSICNSLRMFLAFAFQEGFSKKDQSLRVPAIKAPRYGKLPSVYTPDEIKRMLAQVDRSNPRGKRDYAMLLLAVQYGIRIGDIKTLKLTDLDFEKKQISFVQGKTQNTVCFDMMENVGWALIDYLKDGRPNIHSAFIFLSLVPPFQEFAQESSLAHILNRYFSAAKISTENRRHGMHALRHSLASRMLEQSQPLPVISQVLGHSEINSTMTYTRIDMSHLALCTLEVPDVTL